MKRANKDRISAVAALAAVGCAGTLLSGGLVTQKNDATTDGFRQLEQHGLVGDQAIEIENVDEERGLKGEYSLIANIENYPDLSETYTSSGVEPRGKIEFIFHGKSFMARADLHGLEPNCVNCGIHIHEGTTCDTYDAVGDHYWRHDDPAFDTHGDPWQNESGVRRAVYTSDGQGRTLPDHRFSLYSGYGFEMNEGHAVVVHGRDGTRIGCGILVHINEFEKKTEYSKANAEKEEAKEPGRSTSAVAATIADAANAATTTATATVIAQQVVSPVTAAAKIPVEQEEVASESTISVESEGAVVAAAIPTEQEGVIATTIPEEQGR